VTVAQSKAMGEHHLMMGQNPVWIITGEGKS
jgi:precorrin-6B methylase 2